MMSIEVGQGTANSEGLVPLKHRIICLLSALMLFVCVEPAGARIIPISPSWNHTQDLTKINNAIKSAKPWDIIELSGGNYDLHGTIDLNGGHGNNSWSAANNITIRAKWGHKPVLNFDHHTGSVATGANGWGIKMRNVKGWTLQGLEVKNAYDIGINVLNSHENTFSKLDIHHNGGTGLNMQDRSSKNLVRDADSHHNYNSPNGHDPSGGGDADGFGVKKWAGASNRFVRTRAWYNSDDGFDFIDQQHGVEITDSWAFKNGKTPKWWLIGAGRGDGKGDGNGFKLGRGKGNHKLTRSVAWKNESKGFDFNENTGVIKIINSTAWENKKANFHMVSVNVPNPSHILKNNISARTDSSVNDHIKDKWSTRYRNSWNGLFADKNDFKSTYAGTAEGDRPSNGKLPVSNFLALRSNSNLIDAGTKNTGLPYKGFAPDLGAFESSYWRRANTIPEPSSMMLTLLGGLFFTARRRRSSLLSEG